MKPTNPKLFLTTIACAVVLLLAFLGLRGFYKQKDGQPTMSEQKPQPADTTLILNNKTAQAETHTPPATSSNPATPVEKRLQQLADAPNHMNVPIYFYGKVVDQDNAALSGVNVTVSLREWIYIPSAGLTSRHPKMNLQTDLEGNFEISNARGNVVTIEALEKEGYEPEPKALRGFGYTTSDPLRPDPNNPIVFRLWKAGEKAQLVTGGKRFSIVPDGRTYAIDLLKGLISESPTADGDLRVSIRRPETAAWGQRYDWTLDVQAIDGGLVEETDASNAMFRAPADGYVSKWRLDAKATDESWSYGTGLKRFYLKSRGGQNYGRLEVEAYAYYLQDKQGRFNITWAVNPAGELLLR